MYDSILTITPSSPRVPITPDNTISELLRAHSGLLHPKAAETAARPTNSRRRDISTNMVELPELPRVQRRRNCFSLGCLYSCPQTCLIGVDKILNWLFRDSTSHQVAYTHREATSYTFRYDNSVEAQPRGR